MHAHLFDPYLPISSPVHALDSRIKLTFVLLFLLGVALAPPGAWAAFILYFSTVLAVVIVSGIPPLRLLRRSAIALPFTLAAVPLLFTTAGTVWTVWRIGSWTLEITTEGIYRFVSIGLKSWISVLAALLLSAVTPFPDLLQALRALGVPKMIVSVVGLMWRYLFLLADEALRLIRARDSRSGAEPGRRSGGTLLWRARVTGGMAGSLFVRGFDRADRVYASMLARGYDGETRSLPAPPIPRLQYLVLGVGIFWLLLLALIGLLIR
jgi:cobalt/nickel transport system permease protein